MTDEEVKELQEERDFLDREVQVCAAELSSLSAALAERDAELEAARESCRAEHEVADELRAEAAAAIAEREARIRELREALRPFAEILPGAAFIEPGNQYVANARRIYAATGAGEGKL